MDIAWRLITRIVIGTVLSIWLVRKLDNLLSTTPWLMIASIAFVMIGSLYLLVKESEAKGKKS